MSARITTILIVTAAVVVFGLLTTPMVLADVWDHKTTITVNQPFEIPGQVLPAGTYVFRLVDIADNRTVFRVFSKDEKTVIATLMGIPDFRMKPSENADVTFFEAKLGEPPPLQAWFYTGYQYGVGLAYPERRAAEIAYVSNEPVLAAKIEPEEIGREKPAELTVEKLMETPLVTVEPGGAETAIATLYPEELLSVPSDVPAGLPRTATPFPLFGFIGLAAAGVASALRMLRRA